MPTVPRPSSMPNTDCGWRRLPGGGSSRCPGGAERGRRLAKCGGSVLIARPLWKGRVANPARRDNTASAFPTLLTELGKSAAVAASISPAGDGVLHVVKLTD